MWTAPKADVKIHSKLKTKTRKLCWFYYFISDFNVFIIAFVHVILYHQHIILCTCSHHPGTGRKWNVIKFYERSIYVQYPGKLRVKYKMCLEKVRIIIQGYHLKENANDMIISLRKYVCWMKHVQGFYKFCKIQKKTTPTESLIDKVAQCRPTTTLRMKPQHRCFSVKKQLCGCFWL